MMITFTHLGGFTSAHSMSVPRLEFVVDSSRSWALPPPLCGDGDSMETGKDAHSLVSIQLSEFDD